MYKLSSNYALFRLFYMSGIYIYIYIYIYVCVCVCVCACVCVCVCAISSQRPKTMGVDYSHTHYMRNFI